MVVIVHRPSLVDPCNASMKFYTEECWITDGSWLILHMDTSHRCSCLPAQFLYCSLVSMLLCCLLYTDYEMSETILSQVYCTVSGLCFFHCSYILENCLNTKLFVSERMFIDLCMTLIYNCEDVYRDQ